MGMRKTTEIDGPEAGSAGLFQNPECTLQCTAPVVRCTWH